MNEVEQHIERLLKTPSLTKSREKFCQTLANTIGADYREDKQAALQEYKIALMKAVIYVLYHKPNRQVLEDPIQTRKLFSQITYNYMKQILNENKIPKDINEINIEGEPYEIAYKQIENMLEKEGIFHVADMMNDKDGYIIEGDIGIINLKTAMKIGKMKEKYSKIGVDIQADIERIEIIKRKSAPDIATKLKTASRIRVMNFEYDSEEESGINRYNIEYEINRKRKPRNDNSFDPTQMRNMMPSHLVDVFDIILDSPKEMGESPNKNQIAKHLDISVNEVNKRLNQLKFYYLASKT
jgi:hypothetical protein